MIFSSKSPLGAALLALLFAGAASAQSTVSGRVVDRNTGEPVPTAVVRAVNAAGQDAAAGQSDATGRFSLRVPAGGTYVMMAERIGYNEFVSRAVEVAAGANVEVEVRMVPATLLLDSVGVAVRLTPPFRSAVGRRFFERMERRDGHFFTPEMLAERQPVLLSTLLAPLPGLRPAPGGTHVVMRRAAGLWGPRVCTPTVYVNGEPAPWIRRLDDMVDRDRLWGIEVYTNYLDAPPGLAPRPGLRECGVIAIWTIDG